MLLEEGRSGLLPTKVFHFRDVRERDAYLAQKYRVNGAQMTEDPFINAEALATWAAHKLEHRGMDEVANWRMLEYWFQVEVFRLIQTGDAGRWRHVGDCEQPYHTDLPRSGSKTKTKWIDLVVAEPEPDAPESVVWIELKDIGRNRSTAVNNARGLGHDLAALWKLDPALTRDLWLHPQPHSMDRGRLDEWGRYGPGILDARHLIAQIVISPKSLDEALTPDEVIQSWLEAFVQRVGDTAPVHSPAVSLASTKKFNVFALIEWLPS